MQMKKAVIYARYSSDTQTEQSIEGQLRVCQNYAKNNDLLVVDTYVDRAMTGTNDMRPDFQRMIKASSKRQWEYVIVYKLDRFSRDKYEMTIHKHTLKENGVKLVSAMENIPDSPEGIILESLLEGMNQYYSAELSQKVLRGLRESYLKGNYTGAPVLFGYDVVDKKNVINSVEGAIVKEIFSLYAQDYTAAYIADEMRKRGIRTKKGKYLTEKAIYKMLQNTKYNGKIKHGDTVYDNIYPKIVDDVLWQSVQHIRDRNKHAPGRKKEIFDFILSGKLVCGDCKRLMVGVSGTSKTGAKHYYYTCLTHSRDKKPCTLKTACKKELEDIVINTTWQLLSDNDSLTTLAEVLCKRINEKSRNNANIKSLETKRTAALKASRNLIAAIEQGIITEQTKERLKELETQISQLDFDIEQEKQRTFAEITPEKVIRFLNKAICGSVQDISVRKALVKYLIRDIVLYNNKIIINYYFAEPLKKHTNSIASVIETEKQSREAASLSEIQSSYKGDNSPPKLKAGQRKLSYFLRRERCSKPGRCKHRPSCTRLRLRHTMMAIAVRRISPPCVCRLQNRHYTSIASAFLFTRH